MLETLDTEVSSLENIREPSTNTAEGGHKGDRPAAITACREIDCHTSVAVFSRLPGPSRRSSVSPHLPQYLVHSSWRIISPLCWVRNSWALILHHQPPIHRMESYSLHLTRIHGHRHSLQPLLQTPAVNQTRDWLLSMSSIYYIQLSKYRSPRIQINVRYNCLKTIMIIYIYTYIHTHSI